MPRGETICAQSVQTESRVNLLANYFEITTLEGKHLRASIYRYDVGFELEKTCRGEHSFSANFKRDCVSREVARALFWRVVDENERLGDGKRTSMAFDGNHTLLSVSRLNLGHLPMGLSEIFNVNTVLPGSSNLSSCLVKIQYVQEHDLDIGKDRAADANNFKYIAALTPLDLIHLLTTQNRLQPKQGHFEFVSPSGSSIYSIAYNEENAEILQMGGRRWTGLRSSVKLCHGPKIFLNADVSNGVYFSKNLPLLEFIQSILNAKDDGDKSGIRSTYSDSRLSLVELAAIAKILQSIRIDYKSPSSCRAQVFRRPQISVKNSFQAFVSVRGAQFGQDDNGQPSATEVSVYDYMKRHHGKILKFPHMQLIEIHQRNRSMYLPIEFCTISFPQKQNRVLLDSNKVEPPTAFNRQNSITNQLSLAGLGHDKFLHRFGYSMNEGMLRVTGKVLKPPTIQFEKKKCTAPLNGDGSWAFPYKFYDPVCMEKFALFCFGTTATDLDNIHKFLANLLLLMSSSGMVGSTSPCYEVTVCNPVDAIEISKHLSNAKAAANGKLDMVFCVLKEQDRNTYANLKRVAETEDEGFGIRTQCLLMSTLERWKPTVAGNIAMKLNAKLFGRNWLATSSDPGTAAVLSTKHGLTVVIGLDVSHGDNGNQEQCGIRTCSVASAVCSVDAECSKYVASMIAQKPGQERIDGLAEVLEKLLLECVAMSDRRGKARSWPPTRVVIYRDGLSDSELEKTCLAETDEVRRAIAKVNRSEGTKAKYAYVVAQKRHNTRLFCESKAQAKGGGHNVPAGTLVDTDIVRPAKTDFFLVSQAGTLGTSCPVHYTIAYNDTDLTIDNLKHLSWTLTHQMFRCTRSVSLPAPIHYAHLSCVRAADYLHGFCSEKNSSEIKMRANKSFVSEEYTKHKEKTCTVSGGDNSTLTGKNSVQRRNECIAVHDSYWRGSMFWM